MIVASDFKKTLVSCQKQTLASFDSGMSKSIQDHLKLLRENKLGRKPNWNKDISEILQQAKKIGCIENYRIISDLWFSREGVDHFISIKTVGPNIDQTEKAKGDMLKLKMSDESFRVYFALPCNPFGEIKEDYAHSPAFKIFDMHNDEVVLIGKEYWDFLGGQGTYERVLEIAEQAGTETKELIDTYIYEN